MNFAFVKGERGWRAVEWGVGGGGQEVSHSDTLHPSYVFLHICSSYLNSLPLISLLIILSHSHLRRTSLLSFVSKGSWPHHAMAYNIPAWVAFLMLSSPWWMHTTQWDSQDPDATAWCNLNPRPKPVYLFKDKTHRELLSFPHAKLSFPHKHYFREV